MSKQKGGVKYFKKTNKNKWSKIMCQKCVKNTFRKSITKYFQKTNKKNGVKLCVKNVSKKY